ncbi:hypothetical protein SFRURICE_005339 [Spodoptera frugiperda]|nr:hypothetical protein SFRURICE_005339 [Spodoptera frugiperda]
MIERIQNKFTRFVYLKLYGVYPGYPLLYPTLFVLGMVGYYKLEVRREVALATYLFKVLRGKTHNPALLEELRLCVPDEYVWRRRRPRLLVVPCARTNLMQKAPLTRALRTLNTIADRMDLFSCTLNEFTRFTKTHLSKGSSPPDQKQTRAYGALSSTLASKNQITPEGAQEALMTDPELQTT